MVGGVGLICMVATLLEIIGDSTPAKAEVNRIATTPSIVPVPL